MRVGIIILFMYHIEQLRSKEIADLQSIAQDLGIKGIKSLDRDSLIYRILDGQAMQNSQSGAPAVVKEENRMTRREHRRNRIHNDSPSKVYTATGEKAVKVERTNQRNRGPSRRLTRLPRRLRHSLLLPRRRLQQRRRRQLLRRSQRAIPQSRRSVAASQKARRQHRRVCRLMLR